MNYAIIPVATIIIAYSVSIVCQDEGPIVKISFGGLQGKYLTSREGRQYSAFLGIPYAKTPKRFHLAEFPDNWENTRKATTFGEGCPQNGLKTNSTERMIIGNENCLLLDIYSPNITADLPVMVFIDGVLFRRGNSESFSGKYFMDEDIILVAINYRLGPLGFLNTGDGEMEANLGLKDQVLALKWVQQNIKAFGGDPSKVTIFGESSGAASVHYHMLSPLSKGLFSKAILQSGTALNPWAFKKNPEKTALDLGKALGCSTENSKQIIECLEKLPVSDIINGSLQLSKGLITSGIDLFSPSVEKQGASKEPFLLDSPVNILNSGVYNSVPAIFTACENAGGLEAIGYFRSKALLKDLTEEFPTTFPISLAYNNQEGHSLDKQKNISAEVKKFYLGGKQVAIGVNSFGNLTNAFSDRKYFLGIEQAVAFHSKTNTVFNGLFSYKGSHSVVNHLGIRNIVVVARDELKYFFPLSQIPVPSLATASQVDNASKYFVALWANFAKTGNPGAKWTRLEWESVDTKVIAKDGMPYWRLDFPPEKLNGPFKERLQLWDEILKK